MSLKYEFRNSMDLTYILTYCGLGNLEEPKQKRQNRAVKRRAMNI